jgi:large subunit ribosomal protein L18
MSTKREKRLHRKIRVRARIYGTKARPRMSVFRSNQAISVQLIDDENGVTMCASSIQGKTIAKAKELGAQIVTIAKKKGITTVVFDRSGYRYHGVVKALADAVREGGIQI